MDGLREDNTAVSHNLHELLAIGNQSHNELNENVLFCRIALRNEQRYGGEPVVIYFQLTRFLEVEQWEFFRRLLHPLLCRPTAHLLLHLPRLPLQG